MCGGETDEPIAPGSPVQPVPLPAVPVRVVTLAPFLPQDEHDALLAALTGNPEAFHPPGGPSAPDIGSYYLPLTAEEGDRPGIDRIRAASSPLATRIREHLPALFEALDIDPFAVSEVPMEFVNGLDGHTGLPHADSVNNRYRLSFLYYLHQQPRSFSGGDLEFYEADPESPVGHAPEPCARVAYRDNVLVAYPSSTFHGITTVQCDRQDFAGGRFVAVGFLTPG